MLKNPFPHILLWIVLIFIFSCGKKITEEKYIGNLDELVVGELILKKDSLTKNIEIKQTIDHQGMEYIVSLADRERTIQYCSWRIWIFGIEERGQFTFGFSL
jgi:hypothetical protein